MPKLFEIRGIRYFFWSNENNEPIHVHVTKGEANGEIWLEPSIKVAYLIGFNNSEEKDILDTIQQHSENFKNKWNEHFRK
jgi:hypothetical protein